MRIANFINAELVGTEWNGPWAMRFPIYHIGDEEHFRWDAVLRHPSQLYQALGEGLLNFVILRWLMIRCGWGGGRVIAAFLVLFGALRFGAEDFRQPAARFGSEWPDRALGTGSCRGMSREGGR